MTAGNSIQDMLKAKLKKAEPLQQAEEKKEEKKVELAPMPVQPPAQQPQVKKEDRFCTLNFPYRFRAPDGSIIAPDVGGIYHPKNREEEEVLEYQITRGLCYRESMLVPPLEA